jgi:L-ascorbate metabolism protein UlaG (beta-lactamase superfamily)
MKNWLKPNKAEKTPLQQLPVDSVCLAKAFPDCLKGLHITWLGHSILLMQIDGIRVIIDPVFSNRASPVSFVGPKRFQDELPVNTDDLPFIDAVFISHNHYDHLDKQAVLELDSKVGIFITTIGVGKHLQKWGIDSAKIREYTWWQEDSIQGVSGETLHFACTPARHFSGRGLVRDKTLWASFVFIGNTHRAFYSGDTSYEVHFKQIGHHYGPFDLTIIENGQYNTAWSDVHLFPEDAVKAHLDLRGRYMLPVHWASFNLAPHDWFEPIERANTKASNLGLSILTPRIGQTLRIDDDVVTVDWWRNFLPKGNTVSEPRY